MAQLLNDFAVLRRYGSVFKLVYFKKLKPIKHKKNIEFTYSIDEIIEKINYQDLHKTERYQESISRAKNKIIEYGLCNDFNFFVTLTLDKSKYDRYNLKNYIKDLGQFIRDNRKKGLVFQYILIPEMHLDGAWHLHGIVYCRNLHLRKTGHVGKDGKPYLEWSEYRDKFGFMSLSYIRNKTACVRYISKYVNKSFANTNIEKGDKLYYCSQGLKKNELVSIITDSGVISSLAMQNYDFENLHVKLKWFDNLEMGDCYDIAKCFE